MESNLDLKPEKIKQFSPDCWVFPNGYTKTYLEDILKQPHTIIAGSTGSGKSTFMNGLIYTALFKCPDQVGFVFIDTKFTEFAMYRNLPHCWAYVTDIDKVPEALDACLATVRDNARRAQILGNRTSNDPDLYIFIDELGDVLYSNPQSLKTLSRIAMLGRASNVHIIAGTQNPNRKTLSPELISNCPCRVALHCNDKVESRQIIGCDLATELPQVGYCLYTMPGFDAPELVPVTLYPDEELRQLVNWWEKQDKIHKANPVDYLERYRDPLIDDEPEEKPKPGILKRLFKK